MTVYVVQKQMKYNAETGQNEPRFSTITKAERWGELHYCLQPGQHPFNMEPVLGSLHEALSGFSDEDHLVLVGNPVLIGLATAIASHYNDGKVSFLQWSARSNDYVKLQSEII